MPESSYALAVKKLSVRAYGTEEMRLLLKRAGHDSAEVTETIKKLLTKGYLNDERLAETLYAYFIEHKPCGPVLLKNKLLQKGLSENIITRTLAGYDDEMEIQLATLLTKKYLLHSKPGADALARFLLRKGFRRSIIIKILNTHGLTGDI